MEEFEHTSSEGISIIKITGFLGTEGWIRLPIGFPPILKPREINTEILFIYTLEADVPL